MNPDLKLPYKQGNKTDREKVHLNKRLSIYLFFLVISFLFWYLQALSKEYTTEVNYTVEYNHTPKGKILISSPYHVLSLKVKGYGFHILKYKIYSLFSSLHLNIDDYRLDIQRTSNDFDYYLITRYTREQFATQLSDVQLLDISPDTLYFKFSEVVDRKKPVKALLDLNFEKQYMLHGHVRVSPDSIIVSGPKALIDTLKFVPTQFLKLKNIADTVYAEVKLQSIEKFIYPVKAVKVMVPAAMYTEWVKNIPIEAINVPDSLDLKTFPGSVNLSCWVAVEDYEQMSAYMFRAVVDYRSLSDGNAGKLRVYLVKAPPLIYNIKFHPKNVDYLIEKW